MLTAQHNPHLLCASCLPFKGKFFFTICFVPITGSMCNIPIHPVVDRKSRIYLPSKSLVHLLCTIVAILSRENMALILCH